jgi:hypothetical protein
VRPSVEPGLVGEMNGIIDDLEAETLRKDALISELRDQCTAADKDIEQLTEELVCLERERDELQQECQCLRESAQNSCSDRRGLLISLEKHVASVEKLKKLEQSSLDKLAAAQKAVDVAKMELAARDETIRLLECELMKTRRSLPVSKTGAPTQLGMVPVKDRAVLVSKKTCANQVVRKYPTTGQWGPVACAPTIASAPAAVSDDEFDDSRDDSILFDNLLDSSAMSINDSLVDLNLDADLETLLAIDSI